MGEKAKTMTFKDKQPWCIARLTELAKRECCLDVADVVIQNKEFQIWSGSSRPSVHHYGTCGLIVHTTEVVDLCLDTNAYLTQCGKGADSRELFLAALFHDIGKTYDYAPTTEIDGIDHETFWGSTDHKRRIYHVSRSALIWNEAATVHSIDPTVRENVLHTILAHHGRREWGSPVSPATRAAWILHLCDSLSARTDDCDRIEKGDNPAITNEIR